MESLLCSNHATTSLAKLEAFLVMRAKTDVALLPQARSALRATAAAARRVRWWLGAANLAMAAVRFGQWAHYRMEVRAAGAAQARGEAEAWAQHGSEQPRRVELEEGWRQGRLDV
jgi:hypothetical protein